MPATVEAPLAVLFTLPGGVTYRRRLDDLPNQRLAAHLAAGLAAATHPHGPIRTRSVAMQYVQTARRMVRELQLQRDALVAAGCVKFFEDKISSRKAERPGLAAALEYRDPATPSRCGSSIASAARSG